MLSVQDTITALNYRLNRLKQLKILKEQLKKANLSLVTETEKCQKFSKVIQESKDVYKRAIDVIYESSVGELKNVLNGALKYIFYDKNYEVEIVIEDKRGTKTLSFLLMDKDSDFEVDVKDGIGNGVRVVLSFIIQSFYLINKDSHILILDEAYSNLSVSYVDRFFEFVKKMCTEKELCIVLVTHDQRFMPYFDRTYHISDGVVKQLKEAS